MQRVPVSAEALHHGHVGADQDQQQRRLRQVPVPRCLQDAFERDVGLEQPGELVEHDDARPGGGACEGAQHPAPVVEGGLSEQLGSRQLATREFVGEGRAFALGAAAPRGHEEHPRCARLLQKRLHQAGLAHLSATTHGQQQPLARLGHPVK